MRSPSGWSYVTFLFSSLVLLGACPNTPAATETESGTTSPNTDSGTTENCSIGSLGCACTQGRGCDVGLVCSPADVCVDESGTTTDVTGSDPTVVTTTEEPQTSTTDSSSSTGPTTQCDPSEGTENPICAAIDPNQPYCSEAGVCGGCTVLPAEDGCGLVAPGRPICNAEDGQCVACTADDESQCGGDTPACNPATNECGGCFEHSHCPDSACDILEGKCFRTDLVLYIRHGLPADKKCTDKAGQGGTIDAPYCSANLAVNHAENSGTLGWTLKFLETDFQDFYHGSVLLGSLDTEVHYALVHEGTLDQEGATQSYQTRFVAPDPVLTVGPKVTVYVHNFAFTSSNQQSDAAAGIVCGAGSNVFLDDSVVSYARGPGILANGCNVHMRRSMVTKGRTEGIQITNGELHMVNSFVTENQYVQTYGGGGIRAEDAVLDIVNSTILGNNNEPDVGADSIDCVGEGVTGQIRNTVVGRTPSGNNLSIMCTEGLAISRTLLDSELFADGNSKYDGESIVSKFLVNDFSGAAVIKNKASAEFLLGMAIWEKGDPRKDYEGDLRVAKVGEMDYPGGDAWSN